MKTIGILGLGLIGGSFAKAYRAACGENGKEQYTVYGCDTDGRLKSSLSLQTIFGRRSRLKILPNATLCFWRSRLLPPFPISGRTQGALQSIPFVVDCCGVKGERLPRGVRTGKEKRLHLPRRTSYGGDHHSGYKAARADLFKDAPMVLVPPTFDNISLLQRTKELLLPAGFGKLTVMTAEEHDRRIAYTSQLAHVVSNAYVKSPTATEHQGCSAGRLPGYDTGS